MRLIDLVIYRNLFGDYEVTNLDNLLAHPPRQDRIVHFSSASFASAEEVADLIREVLLPEDGSIDIHIAQ